MNVEEDAESHELVTTTSPTMFFRLLQTSSTRIFDLPRLKSAYQMAYLVGVSIQKFQDAAFDRMHDFDERYISMNSSAKTSTAAATTEAIAEGGSGVAGSPARPKQEPPGSPTEARTKLKHFAFAWLNNCQDLHDFSINLQDYLNRELAAHLRREQVAMDLQEQRGGELIISGGTMGQQREVDFEDIGGSFLKIGSQVRQPGVSTSSRAFQLFLLPVFVD